MEREAVVVWERAYLKITAYESNCSIQKTEFQTDNSLNCLRW